MLNREEGEKLANAIHALRPDWPLNSLLTFLQSRQHKPYRDLVLQLVFVAIDPATKTPARIDSDGPWRALTKALSPGVTYRESSRGDECDTCHVGREIHAQILTDHDWRKPLPPEQWAKPTPEQAAALQAARDAANVARTTPREPEPERTPRDPAQVIAEHTTQEEACR